MNIELQWANREGIIFFRASVGNQLNFKLQIHLVDFERVQLGLDLAKLTA